MADDEPKRDKVEEAYQPYPDQDVFLSTLVDIVNSTHIELSMTLNIGGTLVTGYMVSYGDYFNGIASDFAGAGGNEELNTALQKGVEKFAEMTKEAIQEGVDAGENLNPVYIHMKDAKFFTPGSEPIPAKRGVWWRGKLSKIQGFSFGVLAKA